MKRERKLIAENGHSFSSLPLLANLVGIAQRHAHHALAARSESTLWSTLRKSGSPDLRPPRARDLNSWGQCQYLCPPMPPVLRCPPD